MLRGINKAFIDIRLCSGIATPPEQGPATGTGDLHKKFAKIGPAVPEICSRTDRHTHRQTYKLIAILRSPTGAQ